jgi:hypothetical protein
MTSKTVRKTDKGLYIQYTKAQIEHFASIGVDALVRAGATTPTTWDDLSKPVQATLCQQTIEIMRDPQRVLNQIPMAAAHTEGLRGLVLLIFHRAVHTAHLDFAHSIDPRVERMERSTGDA